MEHYLVRIAGGLVALALAFALVWTASGGDSKPPPLPPCPTEDAAGPCYWDAETMGNGDGDWRTFDGYSFVVDSSGAAKRCTQ